MVCLYLILNVVGWLQLQSIHFDVSITVTIPIIVIFDLISFLRT